MRLLIHLFSLLFLAASAAGCGSKSPAKSEPPSGAIENPVHPDPDAIQRRKLRLIDPK